MSRESTSLLRSVLAGLFLLVAACGGPAKKFEPSPFDQAAEPSRERDWPLDREDNGGFVGDAEDESGAGDDDAYEDEYDDGRDFDSYDDSEDEVDDSVLEDDDFADEDLEDDDFEDDE